VSGRGTGPARPLVVGAVLLVGLAGVLALGFGGSLLGSDRPATDASPNATTTTATGVETTTGDGPATDGGTAGGGGGVDGDGGDDASPTATPEPATFRLVVDGVERCGTTCRDVTVAIRNVGGRSAENVDVRVRLLADGDQLWSGTESFDAIGTGEERRQTRRVDVGFVGGAKVQANDGYVTIETTIEWDGGRQTFSERRKVT
jgi:hypothetical protein